MMMLYWNTGISSYIEKLETDSTASANMKKQKGSYFDTFLIILLVMIKEIKDTNFRWLY